MSWWVYWNSCFSQTKVDCFKKGYGYGRCKVGGLEIRVCGFVMVPWCLFCYTFSYWCKLWRLVFFLLETSQFLEFFSVNLSSLFDYVFLVVPKILVSVCVDWVLFCIFTRIINIIALNAHQTHISNLANTCSSFTYFILCGTILQIIYIYD